MKGKKIKLEAGEKKSCKSEMKSNFENDIEDNFSRLLTQFPHMDPEILYGKAVEFEYVKDNVTLDVWITKQDDMTSKVENQNKSFIDDRIQYAMSLLDMSSINDLTEKANSFEFSDEGDKEFKSWVENEINRQKREKKGMNIIDSRLQYAMTKLDNSSLENLKEKVLDFKFNDEGDKKFKDWVQKQVTKQTHQAILERRYQVLMALFPDKDTNDLASQALKFGYDQKGNDDFLYWIDQNKKSECGCCFDSGCLEAQMLSCPVGHLFCKECIKRGSESAYGEGKTELLCFQENCKEKFDLKTLESVLESDKFSKWSLKIQSAEVEKAGVSGLESCPFCHYAVIMESAPEQNPTFRCRHPDCGKESCRICHEISHVPLRCDQVEKDDEVKKRIFIENKMSEAMFRRCYKCSRPVIKNGGCHEVTCSCGATMCYFSQSPNCSCNRQIQDESKRVNMAAQEALKEVQQKYPGVMLKIDPTLK